MQPPKTLRVRASGTALVQNHEKLEAGTNAFIGRKFEAGKGFVPNGDEEVPYRPEYARALVTGCLEPADQETWKFTNAERDKHGEPLLENPFKQPKEGK